MRYVGGVVMGLLWFAGWGMMGALVAAGLYGLLLVAVDPIPAGESTPNDATLVPHCSLPMPDGHGVALYDVEECKRLGRPLHAR